MTNVTIQKAEGSQSLRQRAPRDCRAGEVFLLFGVPSVATASMERGEYGVFHQRAKLSWRVHDLTESGLAAVKRGPLTAKFVPVVGAPEEGWQEFSSWVDGDVLIGIVEDVDTPETRHPRMQRALISLADGFGGPTIQELGAGGVSEEDFDNLNAAVIELQDSDEDQNVLIDSLGDTARSLNERIIVLEQAIGDGGEVDLSIIQQEIDDLQAQVAELGSKVSAVESRGGVQVYGVGQPFDNPGNDLVLYGSVRIAPGETKRLFLSYGSYDGQVPTSPPTTVGKTRAIPENGKLYAPGGGQQLKTQIPGLYRLEMQLDVQPDETGVNVGPYYAGTQLALTVRKYVWNQNTGVYEERQIGFVGSLQQVAGYWQSQRLATVVTSTRGGDQADYFVLEVTNTDSGTGAETQDIVLGRFSTVMVEYLGMAI